MSNGKVYVVKNVSDDECCFLIGVFLDKDTAIKSVKNIDIDDLDNADEYAAIDIEEYNEGILTGGDTGKLVFKIEYEKEFYDDCDDYKWVELCK